MSYRINEVAKIVGIKKRTVIFWCEEYNLLDLIEHKQTGNKYSDEVVYYLKIIKILKDSGYFSSSFIKKWMDYFRKTGNIPRLPEFLDDINNKILSLNREDAKEALKSEKKNEDEPYVKKLEKMLENEPDNEEVIMELAEIYREKLNNIQKAKELYQRLVDIKSPQFSEIAKLMISILDE